MLSIKEIKKACQFADGFSVQGQPLYLYYGSYRIYSFTENIRSGLYDLFLQRVIEGINIFANNDHDFNLCIIQNHIGIQVVDIFEYETEIKINAMDEKAKEQAIKYILEAL